MILRLYISFFFFFNDTATTEIYTLSLHDALPILRTQDRRRQLRGGAPAAARAGSLSGQKGQPCRSEEHTSELQSPCNLVCRLLLEKKKKKSNELQYLRMNKNSTDMSHGCLCTIST